LAGQKKKNVRAKKDFGEPKGKNNWFGPGNGRQKKKSQVTRAAQRGRGGNKGGGRVLGKGSGR